MSRRNVPILPVLALAASSLSAQSLLPQYGQVVAELGDSPIGLAPGEVFGTNSPFDTPVISGNGMLLFRGTLTVAGTTTANNNRGLFFGRSKSDLALIVRAGAAEPSGAFPNSIIQQVSSGTGLPLGSNTLTRYRISPNGTRIIVGAQLYDGGNPGLDGLNHTTLGGTVAVNDTVLYWGAPGGLQVLAQQNVTTMPGGAVLSSALSALGQQATSLVNSGSTIFQSNLSGGDVAGTSNDTAWIIGTPGNLQYFLREGDSVNGGANVIPPAGLGFNCVQNEAGMVLHDEKLSQSLGTSPATPLTDQVVFITIGGNHIMVMREDDPAPDAAGLPMPGITLSSATLAQGFSITGKYGFTANLRGAVASTDDIALFVGDLTTIRLVAREGDIVPGTGGEAIDVINNTTSYNDAGGVLFGATLVKPGVNGVTNLNDSFLAFARPGGLLQMIVREGDACPGLPGFVFGNIAGSTNFGTSSNHRSNELGQAMFSLSCNDGANTVTSLYSYDPIRGLELQVVSSTTLGDTMGGGMVVGTGAPLQFPSGDGNSMGFNGNGEFALSPAIGPTGTFVVRSAIGGAIAPSTTVSLCPGTAALSVTGSPNIGDSFTMALVGATGLPFAGYGFAPQIPLPLPCGCSLISDGTGANFGNFDFFSPSTTRTLTIPYNAAFLGYQVQLQGVEVNPTSGGCSLFGLTFGLTDIWTLTIG